MANFPYYGLEVEFSPNSKRKKVVWRPIIEIILLSGRKFISHPVLIDSGSDYNILDFEIASVFGLKLAKGKMRKIYGIGNQAIKTYEHSIQIKIPGFETYVADVLFAKLPGHTLGVLGNSGFFNKFTVEFDYKRKAIEINE